jgi:hypothetical protein
MKRTVFSLAIYLLVFVAVFTAFPGKAEAAFNRHRLIDDSLFSDSGTMSISEVDAFLNANDSCISSGSGFRAIDPVGYSPSGGFEYGSNVTAGTVIAHSAQVYGINPQVLLVTLQKEQSLVTSTSCSTHTIAKAMGYGCPDSHTSNSYSGLNLYTRNGTTFTSVSDICVNSAAKAGFTQQVIRAAWLLKFSQERSLGNTDWAVIEGNWDNTDDLSACYSGYMTQGTFKRCPNDTPIFFDGWATIDGTATHMDTGATAALYRYTPHFHGNQNFVSIFESWFGSTEGTPFFRIGNTSPVYILGSKDNYYLIPTMNILKAYGYGKNVDKVAVKSSSDVSGLTNSGSLTQVAKFEEASIYLVDAGGKHHFASQSLIVDTFGYSWPDEESDGDITYLREQDEYYFSSAPSVKTVIKERGGPRVYSVENKAKRHISDQAALNSGEPPYSSLSNMELSKYFLSTIPNGSVILAPGTLFRIGPTPAVYLVNNHDESLKVPSQVLFNQFGFSSNAVRELSPSNVDEYQPESGTLDYFVKKPGGQVWLIHSGRYRAYVSGEMADESKYDLDISAIPIVHTEVITSYKAGGVQLTDLIRASGDPKIYLIENGLKRWVTSMSAFEDHGGHGNLTEVSQPLVNSLSNGTNVN